MRDLLRPFSPAAQELRGSKRVKRYPSAIWGSGRALAEISEKRCWPARLTACIRCRIRRHSLKMGGKSVKREGSSGSSSQEAGRREANADADCRSSRLKRWC
jgi:hypothetical protein